MNKALAITAAFAAATALPSAASAATTVNIGTNGSWTITGPGGVPLTTFTPTNAQLPGSWATNSAGSAWISPTAIPRTATSPAGLYTFSTVVPLSNVGAVQTWSTTRWADNIVRSIIVNGTKIFTGLGSTQSEDFRNPGISKTFTDTVWKNGDNTIVVELENGTGLSGNPTGFKFASTLSAVPEPGTWMLMILGLGAVGFAMRRRQTASVRLQFA